MKQKGAPLVCSVLLLVLCWSHAAFAASFADPILNPRRDYLVNAATQYLLRAINGSIEVGALRGSLFSSPALKNIIVRDAQGEVVGRIEEVRLSYALTSLIHGSLAVEAIDIVRPWFKIVQESDGTLNISKLLALPQAGSVDAPDAPSAVEETPPEEPSSSFGLPFALAIDRLQVYEGDLELQVPTLSGVQTVEGIEARLSGEIDAQGLRARLRQMTAHIAPADLTLQTLKAGFQAQAGHLQIDDLCLQMADTVLTAAGTLPWTPQPTSFGLQIQPLDVAEIGRLLQRDILHGRVELSLQAEGPADALMVDGQLSTDGGHVDLHTQLNMRATPLRYRSTEVAARQQRYEVRRFDVNTSVVQMTASGAVDLAGHSDLQYELGATLANLQSVLETESPAGTAHLQDQVSGDWPALGTYGVLEIDEVHYQDNSLRSLQLHYTGSHLGDQAQVTAQLVARQVRTGTLPVQQVELDATYQESIGQIHLAAEIVQSADASATANGAVTLTETGQRISLEQLTIRLPDRTWSAVEPLQIRHEQQRLVFEQVRLAHADESIQLSGAIDGTDSYDGHNLHRRFGPTIGARPGTRAIDTDSRTSGVADTEHAGSPSGAE